MRGATKAAAEVMRGCAEEKDVNRVPREVAMVKLADRITNVEPPSPD